MDLSNFINSTIHCSAFRLRILQAAKIPRKQNHRVPFSKSTCTQEATHADINEVQNVRVFKELLTICWWKLRHLEKIIFWWKATFNYILFSKCNEFESEMHHLRKKRPVPRWRNFQQKILLFKNMYESDRIWICIDILLILFEKLGEMDFALT